ncbi:MAG: EAL domain-containing protein [Spirochaetales bacterium]|nr:EAL domain-containing protein [Spirochaetales bacterium]
MNKKEVQDLKQKISELEQLLKERSDYIDYLEKLTIAHSNEILNLDKEREYADQTIKAYETLQRLSEQELKERDEMISAHQSLIKLSSTELLHKNAVLNNILELAKYLNTIIQEENLLRKTLANLIKALNFERRILFLRYNKKLLPKTFVKISKDELKKEYFTYPLSVIQDVLKTKKSVLIKNKKCQFNSNSLISIVCVPIVSQYTVLGVIYTDVLGRHVSLTKKDISIAEIFCTQASISLNNLVLYRMLKQQSITDRFTGLSNRKKLEIDLETPGAKILALLNIDGFSSINMAYGMEAGNYVLRMVAKKLKEISTPTMQLYKLSGDEFVILSIDKSITPFILKTTIQNVLSSTTIKYKNIFINISLSMGIVQNEDKNLLHKADIALKRAKNLGHGYMFIYNEDFDLVNKYKESFYWVNKVKQAVRNDQMLPYFQGIRNNSTRSTDLYECLVRIIDDGKVIEPKNFLESAKQVGLYNTVSYCMIDKCFSYFKDKQAEFSINLSREDFSDTKLIEYIEHNLKTHNIDPQRVIFEVLEEFSLKTDTFAFQFVKNLKSLGVKIAIDDFGSEYSNFSRILSIETDYIKIAGAFIQRITHDENTYKIVKAITDFTHSINAKVIAEHVATNDIQEKILELGIDFSQGNLFSVPAPAIQSQKQISNQLT